MLPAYTYPSLSALEAGVKADHPFPARRGKFPMCAGTPRAFHSIHYRTLPLRKPHESPSLFGHYPTPSPSSALQYGESGITQDGIFITLNIQIQDIERSDGNENTSSIGAVIPQHAMAGRWAGTSIAQGNFLRGNPSWQKAPSASTRIPTPGRDQCPRPRRAPPWLSGQPRMTRRPACRTSARKWAGKHSRGAASESSAVNALRPIAAATGLIATSQERTPRWRI